MTEIISLNFVKILAETFMNNDEKATILIPWAMTLAEKKKQRFNMYVRSNACLQKSNDKSLKAEG